MVINYGESTGNRVFIFFQNVVTSDINRDILANSSLELLQAIRSTMCVSPMKHARAFSWLHSLRDTRHK